jgi:hypothetical protein
MSQENVDVVRSFMDAVQRFFNAYWKDPRSIAEAVEADDLWPEYRRSPTHGIGSRKLPPPSARYCAGDVAGER